MPVGKLQNYVDDKGFGFLKDEQGARRSIFVHSTAFQKAGLYPETGAVYDYRIGVHAGRELAVDLELIHSPVATFG
jgi:cold shock CspA family protein